MGKETAGVPCGNAQGCSVPLGLGSPTDGHPYGAWLHSALIGKFRA